MDAGTTVSECLLHDYTRLRAPARLSRQIVNAGYYVQSEGAVVDTATTELGWLVDNARRPKTGRAPHPDQLEAMTSSA